MMKKNKNLLIKIIGGLAFLLLWFGLTMWFILIFDKSFLVLSYPHKEQVISEGLTTSITKGQKISGEITAQDNGLGIVMLRFKSSKRIPYMDEDVLTFRLKEKGVNEWYYVNNYRSGFIYDLPSLPFGFPVIEKSKGKSYVFELESTKGNNKNAVILSSRDPVVTSKYQFDKSYVLSGPGPFVEYIVKKFINSIKIVDIYFSSFVFLLPFISYVFLQTRYGDTVKTNIKSNVLEYATKYNSNVKKKRKSIFVDPKAYLIYGLLSVPIYFLFYILLGTVLIDIVLFQIINDLLYPTVGILWLLLQRKYRLSSLWAVIVLLFFLSLAPLMLVYENIVAAEKAGSWAFTFLIVVWVQGIIEYKSSQKVSTTKKKLKLK